MSNSPTERQLFLESKWSKLAERLNEQFPKERARMTIQSVRDRRQHHPAETKEVELLATKEAYVQIGVWYIAQALSHPEVSAVEGEFLDIPIEDVLLRDSEFMLTNTMAEKLAPDLINELLQQPDVAPEERGFLDWLLLMLFRIAVAAVFVVPWVKGIMRLFNDVVGRL